ncbi:MAG: hypothetical protein K0R39_3021 [Symbiobacteriaceae bacterium]|jgi:hypothetical protein|nr:hypothetical protein [Symbiobacteriaceae bacterium]
MNLIESLLGLLTKENKPLHVGEVMGLWKLMLTFEHGRTMVTAFLNHTADAELKRLMESYLSDFAEPWVKRLAEFMKNEGIQLPSAGAHKPKANESEIPTGAKFTDAEIATFLTAKARAGTGIVQEAILECMNYRLAQMLMELEVASYRQAFVLRETAEKRGWVQRPPTWHGRSRPQAD